MDGPTDPSPGPDRRPRPGPAPSRERLEDLARAIASGSYRVDPRRLAEAILRTGPPARRD
jgi:hypothetical protein